MNLDVPHYCQYFIFPAPTYAPSAVDPQSSGEKRAPLSFAKQAYELNNNEVWNSGTVEAATVIWLVKVLDLQDWIEKRAHVNILELINDLIIGILPVFPAPLSPVISIHWSLSWSLNDRYASSDRAKLWNKVRHIKISR